MTKDSEFKVKTKDEGDEYMDKRNTKFYETTRLVASVKTET